MIYITTNTKALPTERIRGEFYSAYCFADFAVYCMKVTSVEVYIGKLNKGQQQTIQSGIRWLAKKGFTVQLIHYDLIEIISSYSDHYEEDVYALEIQYSSDIPQDALYFCLCHIRFFTDEYTENIPRRIGYKNYLRHIFGEYVVTNNNHLPFYIRNFFKCSSIHTESLIAFWDTVLEWRGPSISDPYFIGKFMSYMAIEDIGE